MARSPGRPSKAPERRRQPMSQERFRHLCEQFRGYLRDLSSEQDDELTGVLERMASDPDQDDDNTAAEMSIIARLATVGLAALESHLDQLYAQPTINFAPCSCPDCQAKPGQTAANPEPADTKSEVVGVRTTAVGMEAEVRVGVHSATMRRLIPAARKIADALKGSGTGDLADLRQPLTEINQIFLDVVGASFQAAEAARGNPPV